MARIPFVFLSGPKWCIPHLKRRSCQNLTAADHTCVAWIGWWRIDWMLPWHQHLHQACKSCFACCRIETIPKIKTPKTNKSINQLLKSIHRSHQQWIFVERKSDRSFFSLSCVEIFGYEKGTAGALTNQNDAGLLWSHVLFVFKFEASGRSSPLNCLTDHIWASSSSCWTDPSPLTPTLEKKNEKKKIKDSKESCCGEGASYTKKIVSFFFLLFKSVLKNFQSKHIQRKSKKVLWQHEFQ